MKIKNILLPVDGSEHSKNATEYAIHLAKMEGAKVHAVTCYEPLAVVPDLLRSTLVEFEAHVVDVAKETVECCKAPLEESGVEFDLLVKEGEAGKVLSDMAKSGEYDLVIMGSHGHSDIAGLFLGSVTHKVLNTIYCPVMIVP